MNRLFLALAGVVVAAALSGVSWTEEGKAPQGKALLLKYRCSSCHSIEAAGVVKKAAEDEEEATTKRKPPDLSGVGLKKKADWIALFLQKKEKLEGKLHPKKFRGTEKELQTIAAWLETMKTAKAGKAAEKEAPTEKTRKAEPAAAPDSAQKADSLETARSAAEHDTT